MEIRKFLNGAVVGAILFWVSAGGAAAPMTSQTEDTGIQQAADAQTAFAVDLYRALAGLPSPQKAVENFFFSPYSISSALAIVYAGARSQTEAQFSDSLHFWLPQEDFHKAMGGLEKHLRRQAEKGDYELTMANALWIDRRTNFAEDFLSQVHQFYSAHLERVDFASNPSRSARFINQWVEKQTRERIKNLIPEGTLDALTRLVVTNAVYFKGKWAFPFDPQATRPDRFTVSTYTFCQDKLQVDSHPVQVPMMFCKETFGYAANEVCQVLRLPYKGGHFQMVILLPREADLYRLEQALSRQTLTEWLDALRPQEVEVYLPRFTFTFQSELKPFLIQLGLTDAFSMTADFSGITGGRDLFLTNVFHKAFIQVDEEGTEAAAATGGVMKLVSMPALPPVFRVDKPFLFLIQDKATGTPLFVGRVTDPTKKQ